MWDTLIIEPMVNLLLLIYQWVGANFGIAIILFTILIRLITYPLTTQQMKSSQKMQSCKIPRNGRPSKKNIRMIEKNWHRSK